MISQIKDKEIKTTNQIDNCNINKKNKEKNDK